MSFWEGEKQKLGAKNGKNETTTKSAAEIKISDLVTTGNDNGSESLITILFAHSGKHYLPLRKIGFLTNM